jgi:hypothetical protein
MRCVVIAVALLLFGCTKDEPAPAPAKPPPTPPARPDVAAAPKAKLKPAPPAAPIEAERPPPTTEAVERAKALLKKARSAYVAGKHTKARRLARQMLELWPGNHSALEVVGAASCYLKDPGQARWALERMRPATRNLLRNICTRNGVNLN